jgi:hypothetical protein
VTVPKARWACALLLAWYFSVYHADDRMWLGPAATYGPFASLRECAVTASDLQWRTTKYSWATSGKAATLWTTLGLIVGLCEDRARAG